MRVIKNNLRLNDKNLRLDELQAEINLRERPARRRPTTSREAQPTYHKRALKDHNDFSQDILIQVANAKASKRLNSARDHSLRQ